MSGVGVQDSDGAASAEPRRVLAVDIGGTKINAAMVSLPGAQLGTVHTTPTPAARGAQAVVQAALSVAREALESDRADHAPTGDGSDAAPLVAVGIASAGVIDADKGVVTAATSALPGWPGTDLAGAFGDAFGVPARALNDVHAHGLGEYSFGAGQGRDALLLVAIGTGIGGAIIAHSRVLTGAGGAAGHVGHVSVSGVPGASELTCSCGRVGHLEGFASGPGIAAELTRRGVAADSTREVAAIANDPSHGGSRAALGVLMDAGFATGRAIGGLLNVLDPGLVAITGGVSSADGAAGNAWWGALVEGVEHDAMDAVAHTPIVVARAGNYAALLGAAAFAVQPTD